MSTRSSQSRKSTRFERVSSEESPMEPIHGSHNPQCDCISSIRYAQGSDPEKILPTLAWNANELRPLFFPKSRFVARVSQTFALLTSCLTLRSRPRTILTNFQGLPRPVEGPSALSRSTIPFSIILCSRSSFIIGTISVQPDFSQRRRFRTRILPSRRSIAKRDSPAFR